MGIGVLVAVGILLIYILPFMIRDWGVFARGQSYYHHAFVCEWEGSHERYMAGRHSHLYSGIGFAVYALDFLQGAIEDKVTWFERMHLWISAFSVVLSGWVYSLIRARIDYRFFALLALKFYFVFFYLFIPVPYNYLYIVPTMVSAMILAMMDSGSGCQYP